VFIAFAVITAALAYVVVSHIVTNMACVSVLEQDLLPLISFTPPERLELLLFLTMFIPSIFPLSCIRSRE